MTYSITLLYAGLSGLLLLYLSFQVVALRRRHQIGLGTGGHPALERVVRAHANFCEYAPLGLLLLLVLEISGLLPALVVHGLGAMLVVGRILHAAGLSRSAGTSKGRFVGTLLTWLMILVSALLAVGLAVGSMVGRLGAV
ncbi:MAG: hypothetical protein EA419_01110 [Wenzhouxiangella sp.]|nr:MAG: hypothetical protein EA419_01110 [Wenzhouxiangella sp.]